MDANANWVWYFAYGSNLDPRTFLGRRGMRPQDVRTARLGDWRLVFDLPVGPGERAVANLLAERGARVRGVAYQISASQAAHLDRTEGVPKAYQREPVELVGPSGAKLAAFTYVSTRHIAGRKPSERYMGLLLHGARHHGLPADYIDYLRNFELAIDERSAQGELFGAPRRSGGTR
jgi:cation transport regulator ChaC